MTTQGSRVGAVAGTPPVRCVLARRNHRHASTATTDSSSSSSSSSARHRHHRRRRSRVVTVSAARGDTDDHQRTSVTGATTSAASTRRMNVASSSGDDGDGEVPLSWYPPGRVVYSHTRGYNITARLKPAALCTRVLFTSTSLSLTANESFQTEKRGEKKNDELVRIHPLEWTALTLPPGLQEWEREVKEGSRKYRRTSFTPERWAAHRSVGRYWRHVTGIPTSRVVQGLLAGNQGGGEKGGPSSVHCSFHTHTTTFHSRLDPVCLHRAIPPTPTAETM